MARPKCPNHLEPLILEGKNKFAKYGTGICPVSGADFDFKQSTEESKKVLTTNGTYEYEFEVEGDE